MAFVELQAGMPYHAKTTRLSKLLRIPRYRVVGHLCCLWSYMIDRHPGGLVRVDEVEAAAEWPGRQGALLEALISCRWVDESSNGMVEMHDWHEYTKGFRKAREDYARRKRGGSAEDAQKTRGGGTEEARNPRRGSAEDAVTRPDQTRPDQTVTSSVARAPSEEEKSGASAPEDARTNAELVASKPIGTKDWEGQQIDVWNSHPDSQPIARDKGARLIRVALARKAKRADIERVIWDSKACVGKKLYEILDTITPAPPQTQNGPTRKSWTEVLAELEIGDPK